MVLFRSTLPDVEVPENVTTWQWLFESPESSPLYAKSEKPLGAFIDAETKERLDFAEIKAKSTALSNCLIRHYGLRPHDTVTLFSNNNIWYPVCMFAVIRAGGRLNGASPAYTVDEMAYALTTAKAKIVFTLPASLDRTIAAAKQAGLPLSNVLLIRGTAAGVKSVQDLMQETVEFPPPPPFEISAGSTNKELCGYLNFSSGTTGLPKAVMLSHHNIIAQCMVHVKVQVDPENYKLLAVMPLFHITGTWRFMHYPIMLNADAVLLPTFSMPAMLRAICDYRVEELPLVPPILLRLARDAVVDEFDLSHVKRFTSGAAPVSPEVLKTLESRFPWTKFRNAFGCTEAPLTAAPPQTHYDYKYGPTVGMLVPNTSAKIIDTAGNDLGPGEMGELLVKGPQVSMGYLDNEKATADSFDADGFYHTGDAASIDEDGMISIKDRIKEMIKVKGSQVPPAELEDLLLGHETVNDCGVVGQPDEYAGELPKAYVVLKSHIPVTDQAGQQLIDYVREHKVRYKWLAEVELIEAIPKSPAGKILRRQLRERERDRLAGKQVPEGRRVRDRQRARR